MESTSFADQRFQFTGRENGHLCICLMSMGACPVLRKLLDERRVMADDVFDQERPVLVLFKATEQIRVDLTTGEARRQTASQQPPEEGDAASGVPAGTKR